MSIKAQNIRKQLQEILIDASEILEGKGEILDYNVNDAITKVKDIREQLKDEDLWSEGVSTLKILFRIRKKQDEVILKILSGDLEYFGADYSEAILKYLENEDLLRSIGNRLYRTQKINQTFPNLDLNYAEGVIFNSAKNCSITVEKFFLGEEIDEIEIPEGYKSKKFKETLNALYRLLKKNKKLPLLETVLSDSFSETFLRIQCMSYLFQNAFVKLVRARESERARAGRWMLVDSSAISNFKDEESISSSIIFGLSYNNWKKLQPYLKKNDFDNRPVIPTID